MPDSLPYPASLTHLRKQAKSLLTAVHAADERAVSRIRQSNSRLESPESVRLADAQYAVAREYGFEHWAALKSHVLDQKVHRDLIRRAALLVANREADTLAGIRALIGSQLSQVAILMIAIGQESAGELLKALNDEEVDQIAGEITSIQSVTAEQEDEAIVLFEEAAGGAEELKRPDAEVEAELGRRRDRARSRRLALECSECVSRIRMMGEVDQEALLRILAEHGLDSEVLEPDPDYTDRPLDSLVSESERLRALEQSVHDAIYVSRGGPEYARGALAKAMADVDAELRLAQLQKTPTGAIREFCGLGGTEALEVLARLPVSLKVETLLALDTRTAMSLLCRLGSSERAEIAEILTESTTGDGGGSRLESELVSAMVAVGVRKPASRSPS